MTEIYKHFKGNYYQKLGEAFCSETTKTYVIYQALYNHNEFGSLSTWIREKDEFYSILEDGTHRFTKMDKVPDSFTLPKE